MKRPNAVGLRLFFAAAVVVVSGVSPCAARGPKVTADTQIWRVVDKETGAIHYAQSIEAEWYLLGG